MERDYRVICDRSGFKAWRSECRKEWDGKLVLKRFWRRRNPLDFAPPVIVPEPLEDPRPEGATDTFIQPSHPGYFTFQNGDNFQYQDNDLFEFN